jgi:dipeptidyl aminopeptidase/acylaminoacyl peptidase/predicted Ser/Thr protein kinase
VPELTGRQFERVEDLYFRASALPAAQRESFLDSACPDDPDVLAEVRGMLAHAGSGTAIVPGAGSGSGSSTGSGTGSGPGSGGGGAAIGPGSDPPRTLLDDALANLVAAPASRKASDVLLRQLIGTRVGAYEFTDILGQGGMGVVYLARDTRLGRTVAIKALPPGISRQPSRMSRFVREAKILASVSHANIATVYGLEETVGTKFLVMERIEGETLARCLSRGALPVEEAIEIARDIAAGVEAAHAAGVVHRDLKPGNVMFKADGRVKVLDFGLAREVKAAPAVDHSWASEDAEPSLSRGLTAEGSIVGTPGYMSPEQIRGRPVDRRTDVFSLGCILYECLAGRVAFPGATGADVIAGILERDPDGSLLPANTPASVRRLLTRCLAKDPDHRMRDMGDVLLELEEALDAREWVAPPASAGAPAQPARRRLARLAPVGVSAALLAAAVAVVALRPAPPAASPAASPPLRRFTIQFPGYASQPRPASVRLALSRDGARMVVCATDGAEQHLWARRRADAEFHRVPGTFDALSPALSPDGEWLAYLSEGQLWKRRLAGGNPVKVIDAAGCSGAYHWDADRRLTYSPVRGAGIARVSEDGGAPRFVAAPRHESGEADYGAGCALSDGSAVLFTVRGAGADPRIDARHLADGRQHTVVERGSTPRLARTPIGDVLLWERAGTLYAAPFDPATLKTTAAETSVADGVLIDRATLLACYDVADDWTLAYVPGPAYAEENRLSWVNPEAFDEPPVPAGEDRMAYAAPHFTADGRRLSVVVTGEQRRAYVFDTARGAAQPVLTQGDCAAAAISPDGNRLAFVTNRDGPYALWLKDLNGGEEVRLTAAEHGTPGDPHWSADGGFIAFTSTPHGSTRADVWVYDVAQKKASPLCAAPDADERAARFSPNGNWVAYSSNESGSREVYIRSFPDGKSVRRVSIGSGGDWPEWTADGRKLYYRGRAGLYLAPVARNWSDGSRPVLVYRGEFGQCAADLSDYAVAPDGRLLIVEPAEDGPTVSQVVVLLNWHQLLQPGPTAQAGTTPVARR